jgi:hypothetical protein
MEQSEYGGMVDINLGDEIIVTVDAETANQLQGMLFVVKRKVILFIFVERVAAQYLAAIKAIMNPPIVAKPSSKLWSTTKESAEDNRATLHLLQMRKKLDAKFTDKKTVKNSLWQEIADLNRSEFSVGTGLEALTVLIRYWSVIRALEE